MAIQFRSRLVGQTIQMPIVGQTTKGYCCGPNLSDKTKTECINLNGYFLPGETTSINCPADAPCAERPLLAELSGACCYWEKADNYYYQTCKSTNTQQECADSNKGKAEGLPYSFYPGEVCANAGGNIACNGVKITVEDISNNCNPNDTSNCFNPINLYGNCCTINGENIGIVNCSITTENECGAGLWSAPGISGILSCAGVSPCSKVYSSVTGKPVTVLESQIINSKDLFEKLPNIGEQYQGGIFVGIFRPGTPTNSIGSTVYGNAVGFKESSDYEARSTGPGTKQKAWILIASNEDYGEFGYNSTNEPLTVSNSSVYDGYYNTHELEETNKNVLMDAIRNYQDAQRFNDWYIPSQDELAFYFKNIAYGYSTDKFKPLLKTEYMSSTTYVSNQKQIFIGDVSFIYTQNNTQANYGKILLKEKHEKVGIRLFRRIYLDEGTDIGTVNNLTTINQRELDRYLKELKKKYPFMPGKYRSFKECAFGSTDIQNQRLIEMYKYTEKMLDDIEAEYNECVKNPFVSVAWCEAIRKAQQDQIYEFQDKMFDLIQKQEDLDDLLCLDLFPLDPIVEPIAAISQEL